MKAKPCASRSSQSFSCWRPQRSPLSFSSTGAQHGRNSTDQWIGQSIDQPSVRQIQEGKRWFACDRREHFRVRHERKYEAASQAEADDANAIPIQIAVNPLAQCPQPHAARAAFVQGEALELATYTHTK